MAASATTTVTQKGQVTIPVEVRRAMGLEARDKVQFEFDPASGVAVLRRVPLTLADAYGAVAPRTRPEDFRKLRIAFEEAVAEEVAREDR